MARQQDDKEMGNELGLSTPESPSGRVEMATRSRSVPGSRTTSPPVKADESAFAKLDSTFLLQSTARRQLTDAAGAATATDTRRDVRPSTSTAEEYATPRGQEASNMRRTGGANESLTPSSRRDSLLPQLLADDAMINQSQALTTCEFVNEDQMLDARLQVWENKHEARAKKGDVRLGAIETRLNQKRDIAEYPTVACDTMKEELEELKETVRSIQDNKTSRSLKRWRRITRPSDKPSPRCSRGSIYWPRKKIDSYRCWARPQVVTRSTRSRLRRR